MTQGGLHSLPSISTLSYPLYLHTLLPSLLYIFALPSASPLSPLAIIRLMTHLFPPSSIPSTVYPSLPLSPLLFPLSIPSLPSISTLLCPLFIHLYLLSSLSPISSLSPLSPLFSLSTSLGVASLICSLFPSIFPPTARETAPLTDYFLSEENCQKAAVD